MNVILLIVFSYLHFAGQSWTLDSNTIEVVRSEIAIQDSTYQFVKKSRPENEIFKEREDEIRIGTSIPSVLSYLIFGVLFLVIFTIIIQQYLNRKTEHVASTVSDGKAIEHISQIDAVSEYELLVNQGDYRAATRMRFLRLLKELNESKIIKWELDKTNRDYSAEITDASLKQQFDFLTHVFERVWYGNRPINKEGFDIADTHFETFFNLSQKKNS